jgi:tetratricopeptide (TPR) repeat protein
LHGDKAAQTGIPTGAPEGTAPSGIQFYGGIFDVLAASFYYVFHFWSHYKTMHFMNALVGAVGIIFAGKLGKLLGGWGTGILTMLFLVFSPSWFGHNFANPKDIPFSVGYTAGIYYTLLFLRSLPNPGIKYLLGMALSIGWAMGVRIGGLLLIAYLALFLLSYVLFTKQVKVAFSGKIIRQIIVVCVVGYAIAILFWPYAHLGVLTQPFEALKVMSHFFVNIPILYDGNRMLSNQVPWYYIPRYMAYTMPLIVMAGTVLGLIGVAILYKKNRKLFIFSLFVLFSVVFPLAYAINKHSSLYDGWRHFLFIYPPLVVIAALGWNLLVSSSQKAISYGAAILVAAGLVLPAKFTFANHPYESLYYNEIAGGLKGIYGKFDTDYYMLGIKDATQWLLKNEQIGGRKVTIATNTTFPVVATLYEENRKNLPLKYQNVYESNAAFERREEYVRFAKEHLDFKDAFEPGITYAHYNSRYAKDWDYYIGFSRYLDAAQLKAGGWPPEETIYTVKVDGVPIAVVLKRKTKKDLAAFELMKNKQYAEAKEMFLAAVQEHPGNEMAWGQLAKLYEAMGNADSALYAAKQVLRKNPADMEANQLVGTIFLKQQKVADAIAFYKSMEQYSPSVSHFFRGYMYAATGNANAAFAELDEAIAADPYNEQPYKMAIQIAQQMKDQSRAQEYYEKAQKAFPENEEEK